MEFVIVNHGKGSSEFFKLKLDFMKCKGAKPEELVSCILNQIRNNQRQVDLYTTLIQMVKYNKQLFRKNVTNIRKRALKNDFR